MLITLKNALHMEKRSVYVWDVIGMVKWLRMSGCPDVIWFKNPAIITNRFFCLCFWLGYAGTHCEVDIDECESNPCVNDGICRDLVNGFTCTCQPGKRTFC